MNYELLKQHITPEPKRILDIGAHRGDFTQNCRKQFPSAYFFLIEAEQIHEHMFRNENYKIAYLSDKSGEKIFYKSKFMHGNTGDSFYKENSNYYNEESIVKEVVKTETLDEIFNNDEIFDFIKVDTQGSELDILKGGINLIKRAYAFLLEVPVHDFQYNIGAPSREEVIEFMSEMGFNRQLVIGSIILPTLNNGKPIQEDILFLK